jgi:hypothetical protein
MGSVVTVKIPAEVATLQSAAGRELDLEVEYGGVMPWPGIGAYRSSKYALEGMSATLHLEVARFGIRVIVIQPGRVQTNFDRRSLRVASATEPDYDGRGTRHSKRMSGSRLHQGLHQAPSLRQSLPSSTVHRVRCRSRSEPTQSAILALPGQDRRRSSGSWRQTSDLIGERPPGTRGPRQVWIERAERYDRGSQGRVRLRD